MAAGVIEDKRLGHHQEGKRATWPELDVNGRRYDPNGVSTLAIDAVHFVVLPRFGEPDAAALDELHAKVNAAPEKPAEAGKKSAAT